MPEKKGVLELSTEEIISIDLIFTKERLSLAKEKLAVYELKDAQADLMRIAKSKAVLLAKLGAKAGGKIVSAKIVGKAQLAYELE